MLPTWSISDGGLAKRTQIEDGGYNMNASRLLGIAKENLSASYEYYYE